MFRRCAGRPRKKLVLIKCVDDLKPGQGPSDDRREPGLHGVDALRKRWSTLECGYAADRLLLHAGRWGIGTVNRGTDRDGIAGADLRLNDQRATLVARAGHFRRFVQIGCAGWKLSEAIPVGNDIHPRYAE